MRSINFLLTYLLTRCNLEYRHSSSYFMPKTKVIQSTFRQNTRYKGTRKDVSAVVNMTGCRSVADK